MARAVDDGPPATAESPDQRPEAQADAYSANDREDPWVRYLARLRAVGLPAPGAWPNRKRKPVTVADEQALYEVPPSFVDLLPWVEYLPDSRTLLLDDG